MDNNTADKITGSLSLFLRVGFYTFYIPFLEKEYGLKEFLDTLSKGKKKSFNKILIKRYAHVWLKIKSILWIRKCYMIMVGYIRLIIKYNTVYTNPAMSNYGCFVYTVFSYTCIQYSIVSRFI